MPGLLDEVIEAHGGRRRWQKAREIRAHVRSGSTGVFSGDSARILAADGQVKCEREGARQAFFGVSGVPRKLRWDDLDALYFAGYANWN